MNLLSKLASLTAALALFACGSATTNDPDAGPGTTDAAISTADAGPAQCPDFVSPVASLSAYPAMYSGDLANATANLTVAEGVCTDERSYFGQDGGDDVIALTGLTAGTEYVIKIDAVVDISFYIATSCTESAGGPATGECLLFVDEATGSESGDFTAPASGNVFVVVDQFGTDVPADGTYELSVFEAECSTSAECTDSVKNMCSNRQCVQCATDFDCTTTAAPACNASTGLCDTFEDCTGDDPSPPEHGDDGPTGAVALTPALGVPSVVSANICSKPASESDYYTITVAEGDTRVFALDWVGGADLDLYLYDSTGAFVASEFFNQPEVMVSENLAAGTYYLRVAKFDEVPVAAATGYTLTAALPDCSTSFDCTDAAKPVCGPARSCVAGPTDCTGDDAGEVDDGPAGATDITPNVGANTTTTAKVCSGAGEADYFKVTVADGDNLTVTLTWADSASDLDLTANDSTGLGTGFSFWKSPEVVTLTNLPAGVHYLSVTKFSSSPELAAVDYSLKVERSAGGCTTVADCAAEYETQFFRGVCDSNKACQFIDGAAALSAGKLCDSPDDCTSGVCSYGLFQSGADTSICSVACTSDAECSSLAGTKCTVPYTDNFCKPTCTVDTECGANTGSETLDMGKPWDYLTCNATSGACEL